MCVKNGKKESAEDAQRYNLSAFYAANYIWTCRIPGNQAANLESKGLANQVRRQDNERQPVEEYGDLHGVRSGRIDGKWF